jgi:Pyridoxamine 5'-phosphate oxidase
MALSESEAGFIGANPMAAMVTVGADGMAKVARVGIAVVDGLLCSSGTRDRVRTERLRRDPRCTLFVFQAGFEWLGLETSVEILDGADVPARSVRMFRQMQNRPTGPLSWFGGDLTEDEFLERMVDEGRIIYQFDVHRAYGRHSE